MRDAQSLLDKVISSGAGGAPMSDAEVADTLGLVDRGLLFAFVEGLVEGAPEKCLAAIAQVYEYGYELSEFTGELLELVRNATFVRLSEGAKKHVDLSADEIARLEQVVTDVPHEALTRLFNALLDVHDQVSRATRPRIVLEMAVARLASVRPVEPVSGLLARLEQLERRLRGGGGAPPPTGQRTAPRRSAPKDAVAPKEPVPPPPPKEPRRAAPSEARDPAPVPTAAKPAPAPAPATAPAAAPKAKRAPAPPAVDPQLAARWKQLAAALPKLPPAAARLADGVPELVGATLRVAVPSGRALAEARRAKGLPEVQGELRALFPGVEAVEVVPLAGTASPAEQQKLLQQEVLDDPDCKRIIQKLGAELEAVTSLRDDA
jgi:DNA polymerase III gamma/tau subunit